MGGQGYVLRGERNRRRYGWSAGPFVPLRQTAVGKMADGKWQMAKVQSRGRASGPAFSRQGGIRRGKRTGSGRRSASVPTFYGYLRLFTLIYAYLRF